MGGRTVPGGAIPHLSIQFRIELIRVHLALSDLAGARTQWFFNADGMMFSLAGWRLVVDEGETS